MKKIFLILITILPIIVFGQKTIEGKYCSSQDFVGFCIEFTNDSYFIYSSWTCLSNNIGKGKYEIKSKKLILKFESSEKYIANRHELKKVHCQNNDSIKLKFKVYDGTDSLILPFANIILSDTKFENYNDSIDFGKLTNALGVAEFSLLKENKEIWVTVTYVGHRNYSFKINLLDCQDLKIYMKAYNIGKIENEVFKYKLKKINEKEILIIDKDSRNKILLKRKE